MSGKKFFWPQEPWSPLLPFLFVPWTCHHVFISTKKEHPETLRPEVLQLRLLLFTVYQLFQQTSETEEAWKMEKKTQHQSTLFLQKKMFIFRVQSSKKEPCTCCWACSKRCSTCSTSTCCSSILDCSCNSCPWSFFMLQDVKPIRACKAF